MNKLILILIISTSVNLSAQFFQSESETNYDVEVFVEVIPGEIAAGDVFRIYATYEIPEDYHMFHNEELFNIYVKDDRFKAKGKTVYPVDEAKDLLGIPAYSGSVRIYREFVLSTSVKAGVVQIPITAAYQICEDDGTCFLPEEKVFSNTLTVSSSPVSNKLGAILNVLKFVLMAFVGGLILNIMPCVLPLLSVKALNLMEDSHHEKKIILRSSLLYALGIVVSFLVMAFAVIILKKSGEFLGWGFQFQNPLFLSILITVIFVFALSLFDVFMISAPQKSLQKANKLSIGKSYSASFFTGIFAVIVATPCTAPFMGTALGFAFSQTPLLIIVIFTSLALGFAFPFVLLGFFPSIVKKFPKPGKWMNTFKDFMAFLLLGTVVYLLGSLHSLVGPSIKGILWFLLITALALWFFGKFGSAIERMKKRLIVLIISLVLIVSAAYLFVDLEINRDEKIEQKDDHGETFSSELVEEYRSQGKIVFVDFYADWCTTCKINDAAVLNRKRIKMLFEENDVKVLRGDFTAGDKEIGRWLSEYKRGGVPLYILFKPGEEPFVFPEILTISMIEDQF